MDTYVKHITARRMWNYINFKAELNSEEEAHLSGCEGCLQLFKLCVLAETPEDIEWDDKSSQKRPA